MHINLKQQVVPEKNQKVINKLLKYIIIAKEKIKIKRIINNLVPEDLNETKRNKKTLFHWSWTCCYRSYRLSNPFEPSSDSNMSSSAAPIFSASAMAAVDALVSAMATPNPARSGSIDVPMALL